MVFALVYKDVYKKTGERAARERGITLSNGKTKIVRIQGGDDDGDDNGDDEAISLFSSPAMPIRSVQTHRGWVLGNISYMQDAAECGKQFTHDETLAETLTRMKDGESLKDAMGRRGSRGINAHKKKGQGSDAAKQKKGQTSTFISPAPPGSRENELDKSWIRVDSKKESKSSDDKGLPKSCLKKETLTRATRRRKRSIKFGNVEVRFYGRTLGDNPACPSGPPISLSWLYRKTPKVSSCVRSDVAVLYGSSAASRPETRYLYKIAAIFNPLSWLYF